MGAVLNGEERPMPKPTRAESQRAAVELSLLAQVHTLVRIYLFEGGRQTMWPVTPMPDDRQAVMRDHPDLVAEAQWDGIVTMTIADWLDCLDVEGVYDSAHLREDFERLTGHPAPTWSEVMLVRTLEDAPPPEVTWDTMVTYGIFVVDAVGLAWVPDWKHVLSWTKTLDDRERARQLLVEALRRADWNDL